MDFFYNLNKKMSDLAQRQDLAESAVTERDMGKHNNATTGFKALAKKVGGGKKGNRIAGAQFQKMKRAGQLEDTMNEANPIPYSDDQIANVDQYRKERGIQAPTERTADLYPEEADYESKQIAARVNDAIVKATGKPGTYYKFKRYESQMTKDPSYDLLTSLFSLTGLTDEQDQSLRQQLSAQGYLIIGKPGSGVLMITQLDRNGRASLNKRGPLQIPAAVSKANGIAEGACSKCAPAPCKCNQGNAFSGAVAKAKADGIQKGEKIRVGGKTYPVKEADPTGMEESAGNNLRSYVLSAIEVIYQGALAGEEMIDDVADELGDYFTAVKRSGDKTLKQAYSLMRDEGMEAEGDPQLMARVAKKAISMLDDQGVAEGAFKTQDIERQEREMKKSQRGLNQVPGVQSTKAHSREHPLKNVAKGVKAFVQGKPEPMDEAKAKPDYIDLDHDGDKKETMKKAAADKARSTGTAFDPDTRKKMKTDQEGTGNFDKKKISTGTVYTRRHKEDDEEEVKSNEPKKKGRPKGPAKGPERVTAKSYKYKQGRPVKENGISIADRGEYDDEVGQTKDSLHTIVRHARELENALRGNENMPEWVQEKIGQIKGMMTSVTDYILSTHEREPKQSMGREVISMVPEKAPPGARAERMVKGIKKSLGKDGHLSDKDKAIAYATTWKAKKSGKVEEQGTKPDFLDMDKDGDKKETFKKAVADKKEKKVAETTTSGSVATAPETKKSSGGMQFGKGVYEGAIAESYEKKLNTVLAEAMNVTVTMNNQTDGGPNKTINVTADGEDAEKLAEILKLAGLGGQSGGCSSCGQAPCGCQTMDEAYGDTNATMNSPDYPTDTETIDGDDPYLRRFSGGLNGAKSTGQTTIPVIAGQMRRTSTMEENVELERSLFNTWKTYKGK